MPFITVKTNQAVSSAQETALKAGLGKAIELVPTKSESSLMIEFVPQARLWLYGKQPPMAWVEIAVWSNKNHAGYRALAAAITALFAKILSIEPQHIFLQFTDIPAWGAGGMIANQASEEQKWIESS